MATAATLHAERTHEDRLQLAGFVGLLLFVAALQVSIAAAHILLALTLLVWLIGRLRQGFGPPPVVESDERRRDLAAASAKSGSAIGQEPHIVYSRGPLHPAHNLASLAGTPTPRAASLELPKLFIPLAVYGAVTLVSATFSSDPRASFVDSKQLVLFLIVPMVYDVARGSRAPLVVQWIISVGAVCASIGIVQYGVLEYDNLRRRPQGLLGHYMTYSGVLMLVTCAAAARVLYGRRERIWPALIMPALLVALALTSTRSAWVGVCAAIALLLLLKDLRLIAVLPVLAALFFALAPPRIADRFYSMFDSNDPTRIDRVTKPVFRSNSAAKWGDAFTSGTWRSARVFATCPATPFPSGRRISRISRRSATRVKISLVSAS
jgi:O-antigen ligase